MKQIPEPPEGMPAAIAAVWREIVESNDIVGTVDRPALEAYCSLIWRHRQARARVEAEGLVVKDTRGRIVPHPALTVERATSEQIRAWGDRFAPLVRPTRKRGYMADATARAIAAAPHLRDAKYAGAIAAAKTLAWLIDEAQRDSMDALQKAAFGTIPMYVKVCTELQITPASAPEVKKGGGGGKLALLRGGAAAAAGS